MALKKLFLDDNILVSGRKRRTKTTRGNRRPNNEQAIDLQDYVNQVIIEANTTGQTLNYTGNTGLVNGDMLFFQGTGLTKVPIGTSNHVLTVNGSGNAPTYVSPATLGGNISFLNLSDTPGSIGSPGQVVAVNPGGNALEFTNPSTETPLTLTTDGTSTGVTQSGTNNHIADILLRSADSGNGITIGTDGGLFFSTTNQVVVADITARDAIASPQTADLAYVVDASADVTVTSGGALYVYDSSAWAKVAEFESSDFNASFTLLSDTPPALGTAGQVPVVNSGATALEFADVSDNETPIAFTTDNTATGVTLGGTNNHTIDITLLSTDSNNSLSLGTDGGVFKNSKKQQVVADIAARDALSNLQSGDIVYVTDASADATVTSGAATYLYNGSAWVKLIDAEGLDPASTDLSDTPNSLGTAGQLLVVNSGGTALEYVNPSTIGSTTFYSLTDTPNTSVAGSVYYGNGSNLTQLAIGTANQTLAVNSGATAPEWVTPVRKYYQTFLATDWVTTTEDVLTIPAATHGLGAGSHNIQIRNSADRQVTVDNRVDPTTGDVTLYQPTSLGFAGSITIIG